MHLGLRSISVLGLLVASCGEPPGPVESALTERLMAQSDTLRLGRVAATLPVSVRVMKHADVAPGIVVSFEVVAGAGKVAAQRVTSDADGLAYTTWTLGSQPGENIVEARIVGRSDRVVRFRALGTSSGAVALSLNVSGNGIDPDGVTVSIGSRSGTLEPGRPLILADLDLGTYTASITGVAPHCFADERQRSFPVTAAETTAVQFSIECYGDITFVRHYSDQDLQIFYLGRDGALVQLTGSLPGRNFLEGWAPDGSRVVFTNEYDGGTDVYTVRPDGTGLTRLTTDPYQDLYPRWSPDGKRIVFHRRINVAGPYAWGTLNVVNADGSGERQLLDALFHDMDPAWSPDGSQILFSCDRFNRPAFLDVCSVAPDGTDLRLRVAVGGAEFGAWSPDGSRIAYVVSGIAPQRVWVSTLDGSPPVNLSPGFDSYMFDWSPDGSRLLLATADASGYGLATVNRDGSGLTRLPVSMASGWASWSPDGKKIVTDLMLGEAQRAVVVMNPDGSGQRVLEPIGAIPAYRALWNPKARPGAGLPAPDVRASGSSTAPMRARRTAPMSCLQPPGRQIPGLACSTVWPTPLVKPEK
jgi:TolB protein